MGEVRVASAMTVRTLRDLLDRFDDDLEVIVEVGGTRYRTLHPRVNGPCGHEDRAQRAVCLISGRELL